MYLRSLLYLLFFGVMSGGALASEEHDQCLDMYAHVDANSWEISYDAKKESCFILPIESIDKSKSSFVNDQTWTPPAQVESSRSALMYSMVLSVTGEDFGEMWREIGRVLQPIRTNRSFYTNGWAFRRTSINTLTYYFMVQPVRSYYDSLLESEVAAIQGSNIGNSVFSFVKVHTIASYNFWCSGVVVQEGEEALDSDKTCGGRKWRDWAFLDTHSPGRYYTSMIGAFEDSFSIKRDMEFSGIPEVLSVMSRIERNWAFGYSRFWAVATGLYHYSYYHVVRHDNVLHRLSSFAFGFRNCALDNGTTCGGMPLPESN